MENHFEIPIYSFNNELNRFEIVSKRVFVINYIYMRNGMLNIVVNNYKTSKCINFNQSHVQSFKKTILKAIGEYVESINSIFIDSDKLFVTNDKFVTIEQLEKTYKSSYKQLHIIKHHLLTINKEYNRDSLTKNNLINL